MIEPEALADRLQDCAVLLRTQGGATWSRVDAWTRARPPRHREPLRSDDEDETEAAEEREREGRTDIEIEDARDDAAAARYKGEVEQLATRLVADLGRLMRINAICNPSRPKTLANRDLQLAQVAAEGLCVSCWRDDGHITEVELRPEKNPYVQAKPYYKDCCRFCGQWKAEHGQAPPVAILRIHHTPGRRVTTADVAKALGRPA